MPKHNEGEPNVERNGMEEPNEEAAENASGICRAMD
jgi:hypothetical protein